MEQEQNQIAAAQQDDDGENHDEDIFKNDRHGT